jgi:hypothetical protein
MHVAVDNAFAFEFNGEDDELNEKIKTDLRYKLFEHSLGISGTE